MAENNEQQATSNEQLQIWFLGIGGIGMSALARWFRARGHRVGGYDRTPTPLTEALVREGVEVIFDETVAALPAWVTADPAAVLVVRTPAVPAGHPQWLYFQVNGYRIAKRSQVLGELTNGQNLIAVAGTHGKTTTSSMVAHLLHSAGIETTAFLGGIAVNFGSNLLLSDASITQSLNHSITNQEWTVVEADEYDRSFLTLHPAIAVVTSTDADHLDIYGHSDALLDSFRDFVSQIQPHGLLLLNRTADPRILAHIDPTVHVVPYGLYEHRQNRPGAEAYAGPVQVEGRTFRFSLTGPFGAADALRLQVPGFHNVENMVAAATIATFLKAPEEVLQRAVPAYAGVRRRFEFVYDGGEGAPVYVDDYAHHPREIEALLTSLRALYPGRKLLAIFQPHLFSRTRDFAPGFAAALSLADEVVLLPIYPARELPMAGVTAALIFDALTVPAKTLLHDKADLIPFLQARHAPLDVVTTVGAGDIDTLVGPLRALLAAAN